MRVTSAIGSKVDVVRSLECLVCLSVASTCPASKLQGLKTISMSVAAADGFEEEAANPLSMSRCSTRRWLMFFDLDDYLIPNIRDCKVEKTLPQILREKDHCATFVVPEYPFLPAEEEAASDLVIDRCRRKTHKNPQFLKTILQPLMVRFTSCQQATSTQSLVVLCIF
jgi:hypothetical protein